MGKREVRFVDPGRALTTQGMKASYARAESVKIGTKQRRLAWSLRMDDTHKSRHVNYFLGKRKIMAHLEPLMGMYQKDPEKWWENEDIPIVQFLREKPKKAPGNLEM